MWTGCCRPCFFSAFSLTILIITLCWKRGKKNMDGQFTAPKQEQLRRCSPLASWSVNQRPARSRENSRFRNGKRPDGRFNRSISARIAVCGILHVARPIRLYFTSPTLHDRRECQFSFAPRQRPRWIPGIRGRLEAKSCRYAALKSPQPPIHTQACLLETEAIYLHTALQGQPARAEWGNRSDVESRVTDLGGIVAHRHSDAMKTF
jgi:hypothetical protein